MREVLKRPMAKALALSAAVHLGVLLALQGGEILTPKREVIIQVALIPSPPPKVKSRATKRAKTRRKRPSKKRRTVALKRKPKVDPEKRRLEALKEIEKRVQSRGASVPTGVVDLYLAQLRERVWSFWAVPDGLLREGLKAVIRIKIDEHGRLLSFRVEESSGDPGFDRSALQALLKAEPFPPPPGGKPMEVGLVFRPD